MERLLKDIPEFGFWRALTKSLEHRQTSVCGLTNALNASRAGLSCLGSC
jgi:hypothetical protein